MPQITVKYYSVFRKITGKREETIEKDHSPSIYKFIEYLGEIYGGELLGYIFIDDNKIQPSCRLTLNGNLITGEDLEKNLTSGDEIALFTPMSGG